MGTNQFGKLAMEAGLRLPLQVLSSGAGFYLGTCDSEGPVSRESQEYFPSEQAALNAWRAGDWTQRDRP